MSDETRSNWSNWSSEPVTAESLMASMASIRQDADKIRAIRPELPIVIGPEASRPYAFLATDQLILSPSGYAGLLTAIEEYTRQQERRASRAAAFVPGDDVRVLYGWTRKRWSRERRRYTKGRGARRAASPSWYLPPWREHVQHDAANGRPPWHKRNTKETRERDAWLSEDHDDE